MTLSEFVQHPLVTAWGTPIILAVVLGLGARWLRPRSKVVWGDMHGFIFTMRRQVQGPEDPDQRQTFPVHTKTILVQNIGKMPAERVEVYFTSRPDNYQVWPSTIHNGQENPDGTFTLIIDRLVPKETLQIELLAARLELPDVMRVRTSDHEATETNFHTELNRSKGFLALVMVLLLAGAVMLARILIAALMFIVENF